MAKAIIENSKKKYLKINSKKKKNSNVYRDNVQQAKKYQKL